MDKQHIFISYAHVDSAIVHTIVEHLSKNGFSVWIDTQGLTPGTANWEQAIRNAIAASEAVVFMASPEARQSEYVLGELAIAKANNKPVFPAWVNGRALIESVPMSMSNYQYADCRIAGQDTGINQLISSLQAALDTSAGKVTISLPSHERVQINLKPYTYFSSFLDNLFLNYLYQWYEAFTYGTDWVLVNVNTGYVAIGWNWLSGVKSNDSLRDQFFHHWYSVDAALSNFGIHPDSTWGVCDVSRLKVVGVCLNSEPLRNRLLSPYRARDLHLFQYQGCLKAVSAKEVIGDFKTKFIISLSGADFEINQSIKKFHRSVFVEINAGCEDLETDVVLPESWL